METNEQTEEGKPIVILDGEAIRRALRRVAHEIIERNENAKSLILVGIPSRGVELSGRLRDIIREIEEVEVDVGVVDASMHRDDLGLRTTPPKVRASHLPYDLAGRTVVLVDDVFFTGRTARAAMEAVHSYGRPAKLQLAVLVDRGHRELPIRPDYVGKNLPTSRSERVMVRLAPIDAEGDSVRLRKA